MLNCVMFCEESDCTCSAKMLKNQAVLFAKIVLFELD